MEARKLFAPPPSGDKKILENNVQNWIVCQFDIMLKRGHVFAYAGDMNAAKRSHFEAQWAKATGMKAGEPDMRVYLPGGRVVLVELKKDAAVSKAQKERHELLKSLGFDIRVERLKSKEEAMAWAETFIQEVAPL